MSSNSRWTAVAPQLFGSWQPRFRNIRPLLCGPLLPPCSLRSCPSHLHPYLRVSKPQWQEASSTVHTGQDGHSGRRRRLQGAAEVDPGWNSGCLLAPAPPPALQCPCRSGLAVDIKIVFATVLSNFSFCNTEVTTSYTSSMPVLVHPPFGKL